MPTKKNILYIDNEKKYREKVKPAFKKRGYQILLSESGKSGLIKLMKYKPDVVIVNYELPDINGEELYTKFIMDSLEESGIPLNSQQKKLVSEIRKKIEPFLED